MTPETTIEYLRERDMLELADNIRRKYHVTLLEIFTKGRRQHIVMARRELWWELNRRHAWSYQTIAEAFGWEWSTVRDGVLIHSRQVNNEAQRAAAAE